MKLHLILLACSLALVSSYAMAIQIERPGDTCSVDSPTYASGIIIGVGYNPAERACSERAARELLARCEEENMTAGNRKTLGCLLVRSVYKKDGDIGFFKWYFAGHKCVANTLIKASGCRCPYQHDIVYINPGDSCPDSSPCDGVPGFICMMASNNSYIAPYP